MRRPLAVLALAFAAAFPAGAAPGRSDPPPDALSTRRDEVVARLQNLKVTLDFADAPLADVLQFVREISGIDFMVDPAVAERFGNDGPRVTMKVRDLPLQSALRLILEGRKLAAVYREGVVVVVPQDVLDREVVLRIYDVRDMLMEIHDFPGPVIDLKPPAAGGDRLAGVEFFLTETADVYRENGLVTLVRENCGAGTWEENANTSIEMENGLLLVSQSRRVHADIARLLDQLRAAR